MDLSTLGAYADTAIIMEIECPENFSLKSIQVNKEAVCRINGSHHSGALRYEGKWLDDIVSSNATRALSKFYRV